MAKQGVFISHVSEEAALASALKRQIESEFPDAVSVFVSSDRQSIRAGAEWLNGLKAALRDAPIVIVLCSPESVGKPWVNFEAGGGWIREMPVIPICHSGMSRDTLPDPLKYLNAINAQDPAGLQKLHDVIAQVLRIPERDIDRAAFIAGFADLESAYRRQRDAASRIPRPSVLCAATAQYNEPAYGFDSDVAILRNHFGDRVDIVRDLTSRRLHQLLRDKRYQIVHLVMAVDSTSGDLIFSRADSSGVPLDERPDRLAPRSLADQLRRSGGVELAFLATCWSLFLGVDVARVTNMIATHVELNADAIGPWADYFYDSLSRGDSLYEAADRTIAQQPDVPLRLIPHHDFALIPKDE